MRANQPETDPGLNEEQRRLVVDNLALVPLVIGQLHIRRDDGDLAGVGRLALCRAAGRWRKGPLPFAVFAADFIRREILRSVRRESAETGRVGLRAGDLCREEPGYGRAEDRMLLAALGKSLPVIVKAEDLPVARLLFRGMTAKRIAVCLGMRPPEVIRARERVEMAVRRWLSG